MQTSRDVDEEHEHSFSISPQSCLIALTCMYVEPQVCSACLCSARVFMFLFWEVVEFLKYSLWNSLKSPWIFGLKKCTHHVAKMQKVGKDSLKTAIFQCLCKINMYCIVTPQCALQISLFVSWQEVYIMVHQYIIASVIMMGKVQFDFKVAGDTWP